MPPSPAVYTAKRRSDHLTWVFWRADSFCEALSYPNRWLTGAPHSFMFPRFGDRAPTRHNEEVHQ